MTKYIVTNTAETKTIIFYDKLKARIAVDYLSYEQPQYLWFLKIVAKN